MNERVSLRLTPEQADVLDALRFLTSRPRRSDVLADLIDSRASDPFVRAALAARRRFRARSRFAVIEDSGQRRELG